jgi:hypothetical protein
MRSVFLFRFAPPSNILLDTNCTKNLAQPLYYNDTRKATGVASDNFTSQRRSCFRYFASQPTPGRLDGRVGRRWGFENARH